MDGEFSFRPGDTIAVCYSDLSAEETSVIETYQTDKSIEQLQTEKPLHLYDCVQKFTDR